MTRPSWVAPTLIGVTGAAAAAGTAALGGIGTGDALRLLLYAGVGAGCAGLVAAGVLRAWRQARITVQAVVAALAPVLAVAIGTAWATSQMFLMTHDLWVLWVVLIAAGTVGVVTALTLGRRVAAASRGVTEMARRLGDADQGAPWSPPDTNAPGELAGLARELEATSARLREAQDLADATERSRRELVAWVSHDLRTPLAGIRAMTEALEDGIVTDEPTIARYYATIRLETDRLADLVNDLFELSRIQAGALHLDVEAVPLEELVADALSAVSATARSKGIELQSRISYPPPVVDLAAPEIVRVVRNLLDNAIRHTPEGATIVVEVGADERDSTAWISVLDACGGIPSGDLPRLFDMGYRGDLARTPGDGRGGLGLAVARGLIDAHGGQIAVRNAGPGCCFTIRLPMRSAPGPDADPPAERRRPPLPRATIASSTPPTR